MRGISLFSSAGIAKIPPRFSFNIVNMITRNDDK